MHLSKIIKIGLLLLTTANCYATVQTRDPLSIESKEGYIEEKPAWPLLKNRNLEFEILSTGNYCGFNSSWLIESNALYLVSFSGRLKGQGPSGLQTNDIDLKWLFPESGGKVLADWFTGNIHLNLGDDRVRAMGGHIIATDTLIVFHVNKGMIEKKETYLYPDNIDVINKRESEIFGEKIDIRNEIK